MNESTDHVPSVSDKREWLTPTLTVLGDVHTLTETSNLSAGQDVVFS